MEGPDPAAQDHADPDTEAGTDTQSEGVTDEQLQSALAAKYGEDFSVEDMDGYVGDRDNWQKQQNRHNQDAATASKAAQDQEAQWRQQDTELASKVGGNAAAAQQSAGYDRDEFFKSLGVENPEDVVTADQVFRVAQGLYGYGRAGLSEIAKSVGSTRAVVDQNAKSLGDVQQSMGNMIAEYHIENLLQDFPDADSDGLRNVLRSHKDSSTIESALRDEAQRSQNAFQERHTSRNDQEKERRRKSKKTLSMGGTGSAVAGKKLPNIYTEEGFREFQKLNPRDAGSTE